MRAMVRVECAEVTFETDKQQGGRGWVFRLAAGAALGTMALLAGCATPPPPPPPPPVVVIPPLPQPPLGAPDTLTIPPVDANGQRHTVNTGISSTQTIWNLRSAYNVAALNCLKPEQAPILAGYKRFLTIYDKALDNANLEIDRSFQTQLSVRDAARARETYQTQVYNFFALPPVTPAFCEAAMEVSADLQAVAPEGFEAYSYAGLAKLEAPFKAFYDSYAQYMADLAAWEARYGGRIVVIGQSNPASSR
ncbi:hypothetical protein [Novosphingobium colocasiae]|uniref:hypothetical protein n=1 Tax=Novosphingobium colocasiae TaxID=1256513 RepID=UPI0035ADD591